MAPQVPVAYVALRQYLGHLLAAPHDQAWAAVSAPLHPSLTHFMRGKTMYEDPATGQPMVYGQDLAGWARELIYGRGFHQTLRLDTLDVAELRAAAQA